eukprot:CAMPEP_0202905820 /NCGR_PEP_ID=MMETSP1392-20130828/36166_1 /ASSEMBLY_ACC=CAM_ASM_000868 /TAXON_ID=225041 /ORGANISM="Chlamydomonas chlamydogama, Strain SAG 11-48b" /LENGTH=360 /DNA_ID=CAMNT_0049594093 /DNA_START=76 /DNA_END=1158 /DNA_ORIENTATION=+
MSSSAISDDQAFEDVVAWVRRLGGEVNVKLGRNVHGVRGIMATKDLAEGDPILRVPPSAVLNVGPPSGFMDPVLTLIREMRTSGSRFKAYTDTLPRQGEVFNGCNFPKEYIPMLQNEHLEGTVLSWQQALLDLLNNTNISGHNLLVTDIVDDPSELSIEYLKYVCALTSTRYISGDPRPVLLMVPVFDMANYRRACPHYTQIFSEEAAGFNLMAGELVNKGDEICYDYSDLRDDRGVIHYGFLPAQQNPPLLAAVDHPNFNESHYDDQNQYSNAPFDGGPLEIQQEVSRLKGKLEELEQLEQQRPNPDPLPGFEYLHSTLLELQRRRRHSIKTEIQRLEQRLQLVRVEGRAAASLNSDEL